MMYVKCLARVLTRAAHPVEGSSFCCMLLCSNLIPASLQEVHAVHRQCPGLWEMPTQLNPVSAMGAEGRSPALPWGGAEARAPGLMGGHSHGDPLRFAHFGKAPGFILLKCLLCLKNLLCLRLNFPS